MNVSSVFFANPFVATDSHTVAPRALYSAGSTDGDGRRRRRTLYHYTYEKSD